MQIARPWAAPAWTTRGGLLARLLTWDLAVTGVLLVASFIRLWQLDAVGYNSDEAVYAGQAAAIAGDPDLKQLFPAFRAHPLLFQATLSLAFGLGVSDLVGRLLVVAIGLATVFVAYLLGRTLYGQRAGIVAALLLAVMPYHVIVTRQVLLDGPLVLFTTLALYLVAKYATTERSGWLYAAGGAMGLAFMAKETGIVLLGAIYVFFALCPSVRVRIRDLLISAGCMALTIAPFPITTAMAGRSETGKQYFVWQLFRKPNHDWDFYLSNVPAAIGPLVLVATLGSLWLLRRERSWREVLLLAWIVVPIAFFQLWPTKGFQYLLPTAPAFAVLAARLVARPVRLPFQGRWTATASWLGVVLVAGSLLVASWGRIQPSGSAAFLAGTGGVQGGREMGAWIQKNIPERAKFLAIGPSMANIVQFYGHRKAYGLSVSPNPLRRNPSYEAVNNPDLAIRNNEVHYVVWDSFSASRTSFFSDALMKYVERYNGRVVHTESIAVRTPEGDTAVKPTIVIYEVRP